MSEQHIDKERKALGSFGNPAIAASPKNWIIQRS